MRDLAERFFGPIEPWRGDCSNVELVKTESMFAEVEYVAAKILELVRSRGFRFRDVAVAARNLDEYAATIENVFERYGVQPVPGQEPLLEDLPLPVVPQKRHRHRPGGAQQDLDQLHLLGGKIGEAV